MNAIELKDLEKHYRDFDLRISLTLPQGWAWADGSQSVGSVGSKTFKAN